jgi:hypothetical protein
VREPLERGRACAVTTFGKAGAGSAVLAAAVTVAVASWSEVMLAPQDEQNLEFSVRAVPHDWQFSMNGLVRAPTGYALMLSLTQADCLNDIIYNS